MVSSRLNPSPAIISNHCIVLNMPHSLFIWVAKASHQFNLLPIAPHTKIPTWLIKKSDLMQA